MGWTKMGGVIEGLVRQDRSYTHQNWKASIRKLTWPESRRTGLNNNIDSKRMGGTLALGQAHSRHWGDRAEMKQKDRGCSSVVACLPSMQRALSSIPRITNKQRLPEMGSCSYAHTSRAVEKQIINMQTNKVNSSCAEQYAVIQGNMKL